MKKKQANKPNGKERRKAPRYQPNRPLWAIFKAENSWIEGEVISLSKTGLFLAVERNTTFDPQGNLTLFLPDGSLQAKVKVRRAKPGQGYGMEFVTLAPQDQKRLDGYLEWLEQRASPAARHDDDSSSAYLKLIMPA